MAIQTALGSDIAMAFDECPPGGAERPVVERAVERDGALGRALGRGARRAGPAALRDRAGRRRRRSAQRAAPQITALPFDGFALGGLSVGEERELDVRRDRRRRRPLLPPTRPRYFMGIGDPEDVLRVIAAGIDMFDCVLPTRTARNGIGTHLGGASEPA